MYTTTNSELAVFQNGRDMVPSRKKGIEFFMNYKRINLDPTELSGIYKVSISSVKKVAEIMDKFMELYLDYGFQYMPRSQVWIDKKKKLKNYNLRDLQRVIVSSYHYDKTFIRLLKYLHHHGPESWVKLLKWKFASFFSFYEDQQIPPSPISNDFKFRGKSFFKPGNLLGGTFHDFYHQLGSKRDHKSQIIYETFRNTVLNGMKKGAPRVSTDFLKKVAADTWTDLTTEKDLKLIVTVEVPTIESLEFQTKTKKVPTKKNVKTKGKTRADTVDSWELDHETITITKEDIRREIKRTVKEVFQGGRLMKALKNATLKPRFPSTSANYSYSRNKCGGVGGYLGEFRGQISSCPVVIHEDEDMSRILPDGRKYLSKGILFGSTDGRIDIGVEMTNLLHKRSHFYGTLGRFEDLRFERDFQAEIEIPEEHPIIKIDARECVKLYQENYWRIWNKSLGNDTETYNPTRLRRQMPDVYKNQHRARLVILSEPLKGRPITAEDWDVQNVLASFQKATHPILKKLSVFELIGKPLEVGMIKDMFDELRPGRIINSGDYANATNNMYPWASEACIDDTTDILEENWEDPDCEFPSNYVQELKCLLYKSMTKHIFSRDVVTLVPQYHKDGTPVIHKKKGHHIIKKIRTEEIAYQKHGQLMGSIVSFVFLCIINAAVCRYSMELSDRKIYALKKNKRFELANLKINGDDCAFDGWKGRIEKIWEACASLVGLESSIGKTYFSDRMCTINSQIFRRRESGWEESKFINYGLLYGIKKSTTIDEQDPKIPVHKLGTFARDLKRQCPEELWSMVKQRFIYFNMDRLRTCGNIPWFLPEWLGGLGIPNDGELSEKDRCMATIIKQDFKNLKPVPISDAKEWYMHDFVNKQLRQFNVPPTHHLEFQEGDGRHDLKEHFDEAYGILTVSLLFRCELHDLYQEIDIAHTDEVLAMQRAFQHNLKMYRLVENIFNHLQSVTPMEDDDILPEKKQKLIPVTVLSQPLCSMVPMHIPSSNNGWKSQ
jgi:hypothetical protein